MKTTNSTRSLRVLTALLLVSTLALLTACPKDEQDTAASPTPTEMLEDVDFDGNRFISPSPSPSPDPSPTATPTPAGVTTFVIRGPITINVNSSENYMVEVNAEPTGTAATFVLAFPTAFRITNESADFGAITFTNNILNWSGEIGATPANINFTMAVNTPGSYTLTPTSQPGGNSVEFKLTVTPTPTPSPSPSPSPTPTPTPTPTPSPTPNFSVVPTNALFAANTNGSLGVTLTNTGEAAEAVLTIVLPANITIVSTNGTGNSNIMGNTVTWTVTPGNPGDELTIEVTATVAGIYGVIITGTPGTIESSATIEVTE